MRALALLGGLSAIGAVVSGCSIDDLSTPNDGGGGTGSVSVTAVGGGGVGGQGSTVTTSSAGGAGGAGGGPVCSDADSDGVTDCAGDCDDANNTVRPGAPEICGDGVDNACGSNPDPASLCQGIGTYVSDAIGVDTNPGTQALPVLTIAAGMAKAVQLGMTQPVYIAEGSYPEDIDLVEGVDLWGGYSCVSTADCTWARDRQLYVSTIVNTDGDGVYAGHNITQATEVDGLTIIGLSGNPGNGFGGSAMYIQGAPTIRGNHIVGGTITGCSSCYGDGITMSGAPSPAGSALIEANIIDGGASSDASRGISITNGATATIVRNEITGGTANWSRCITIAPSSGGAPGAVSVTGNIMHAGSCNGNVTTFAMFLGNGVTPLVDGNYINQNPNKLGTCPGFTGNWWTGGIESEGSVATIINNVIKGVPSPRSTAILLADCEGTCQVGQPVVVNNTLDGGGQTGNNSISSAIVFKTWKAAVTVIVGRVGDNILEAGAGQSSFGGYEDVGVSGSTCRPSEFDGNSLFGATTMYQRWDGTATVALATINEVNTTVNNATSNVTLDCQVDATGHLPSTSPCIDAGLVLADTPPLDIDGEARPQGGVVDIGADEAD